MDVSCQSRARRDKCGLGIMIPRLGPDLLKCPVALRHGSAEPRDRLDYGWGEGQSGYGISCTAKQGNDFAQFRQSRRSRSIVYC